MGVRVFIAGVFIKRIASKCEFSVFSRSFACDGRNVSCFLNRETKKKEPRFQIGS